MLSLLRCALFATALLMLAGCAASPGSSSPSSASPTPAVDSCLVGTWTTTSVSGTQPSTGATVSGGAGQVLTVTPDGVVSIDPSGSTPIQLTIEGQAYTLTESGMGSGSITTHGGQLTYTTSAGDSLSTSISSAGGTPVGTPAADAGFTATYTCSAGESLSIDDNGVTYSFVPVGASRSALPSPSATPD
jgi:hypothetical protein